jgi:(1->4)-alpha-D-glucan 1-alpha-D-glucosylmutase
LAGVTVRATYRLQLRAGFDFQDVAELADYLSRLGFSHVYLSPIFKAVDGSTHGYDVVDPRIVDPALGGDAGYTRMTSELRGHGLCQMLDIVPNHMATDPDNPFWWDVLSNGPSSRYATFFDIDWEGPREASWSKVLVPVLGDHYGRVLEEGELELARRGGRFEIRYHDVRLPVSPESLETILLPTARRSGHIELANIADELRTLPTTRSDATVRLERHHSIVRSVDALGDLLADTSIAKAVDAEIERVSRDRGRLHELLEEQHYRLAHWKVANEEVDYRRFFNIETLAGVRTEDPDVLAETHQLVFDLVRDGSVDALRIDHIDGIGRPARYLEQVSQATAGVFTVVEKILETDEDLPGDWPVSGTTGYDFLNRVNAVFVEPRAEKQITDIYATFTGETATYNDVLREAKHHVMDNSFAAEMHRITGILGQICSHRPRHRDHTQRELRVTLRAVIASLPVYRLYAVPTSPPSSVDIAHARAAVVEALDREPDLDLELLELITDLTLGRIPGLAESEFTRLFQQLTAPVMAKGAEDTAFYRYNRFLSLNEVGGDPGVFGMATSTFHQLTQRQAETWPDTMLTIGTHDTKRSADVRARLNVLSEMPDEWEIALSDWSELVDRFRDGNCPESNLVYHFFQSLMGAWPIDVERLRQYMTKASREAKTHTSWVEPNPDYEATVDRFVTASMDDVDFVAAVERFLESQDLVSRGRANSLRQVALLLTCPGVPDIYQGNELWDLSLVDPDNRRPVDFERRRRILMELEDSVWPDPDDEMGTTKAMLIRRLLDRGHAEQSGRYEPLHVAGERSDEILAFLSGDFISVIPVRSESEWAGTSVTMPGGPWRDLMSGREIEGGATDVSDLLGNAPLAVYSGGAG